MAKFLDLGECVCRKRMGAKSVGANNDESEKEEEEEKGIKSTSLTCGSRQLFRRGCA